MNWAQWISAQWIKKYSVIPAFAGMTVIFLCVKGLSGGLIAADTTVYPQGSGIFSAQAVETPRPPPMDKPRHYRQTCRFKEAPAQSGNMSVSATFKSADPLTFTLFIAVAVHVVLFFGFTFTAPRIRLPHVMEVTLALHRSDQENPTADYLAQANQQGGGVTDDPRLLTSAHQSPFKTDVSNEVQPVEQTEQSQQVDQVRRQVIATSAQSPFQHDNSVSQDVQQQQTQAQQEQMATSPESAEIATLEARLAAEENAYTKRSRVRTLTSISTRSDRDAAYLDAFRSRVEQIGNRDYPMEARVAHMVGNVRLLVALKSNGSIKSITVLKGSGYSLLDDAAVRSVRMAAPFPPFPLEIRRDTDVLQIIRTWKFTETLDTEEG